MPDRVPSGSSWTRAVPQQRETHGNERRIHIPNSKFPGISLDLESGCGPVCLMSSRFLVTLTADFYGRNGEPKYDDIGLSVFEGQPQIEHRLFKEHRKEIGPDQIGDANGVIVLTPAVTANTVSHPDDLLVIARFGVGY